VSGAAREAADAARPTPHTHCLLLSGGLDSATLAAWIKHHHPGEPITAYTFLYGQKHAVELEAARAVAAFYALPHQVRELEPIRGSALTDEGTPMPRGRDLADSPGVAPTYVPARNLFFLAQVATMQDAHGPATIWLGVHHDDYSGYPDCRPEFIEAADQAVRLGTQYELRVQAPFVHLSKAEIVRWGLEHDVPYQLTHSCYQGRRPACGVCDTCQARLAAFAAAGVIDPLPYETGSAPSGGAPSAGAAPGSDRA
jgi:7-cyano-7-deazaguanine synthase